MGPEFPVKEREREKETSHLPHSKCVDELDKLTGPRAVVKESSKKLKNLNK